MCALSIKVSIRKKSVNLFNDPFRIASSHGKDGMTGRQDDDLKQQLT